MTRVSFNVGDQIASHEDWTMTVDEVQGERWPAYMQVSRTDNNEPVALKEVFLNNFIRSSTSRRIACSPGQIDRMSRLYPVLRGAGQPAPAPRRNPTRGLAGGRVSLIPHQLYIAHEVGHPLRPRACCWQMRWVGKTIEAGADHPSATALPAAPHRVLILLPETLQHQWLVEMRCAVSTCTRPV